MMLKIFFWGKNKIFKFYFIGKMCYMNGTGCTGKGTVGVKNYE